MSGRTLGPPVRLRDLGPDAPPALRRAGALVRALEEEAPTPLDARADARILRALTRPPTAGRHAWRWVPALTTLIGVFDVLGTGFCAAAAFGFIRPPAPPSPPDVRAPVAPAPAPRPAPALPAPAPTVVIPPARPRLAREPAPPIHDFVRARLAIDPEEARYRPAVPPDFARAHAGETFSWRLEICVGPTGAVTSASVLDRVHPLLDRQVIRAVERWRYFPAQQAGRPVRTCAALAYRLALEPAPAGR